MTGVDASLLSSSSCCASKVLQLTLLCHACVQVVEVVVCRLSDLQRQLYEHFLLSNATRRLLAGSKVRQAAHRVCLAGKQADRQAVLVDAFHKQQCCTDVIMPDAQVRRHDVAAVAPLRLLVPARLPVQRLYVYY
jgi:hypothetical protein